MSRGGRAQGKRAPVTDRMIEDAVRMVQAPSADKLLVNGMKILIEKALPLILQKMDVMLEKTVPAAVELILRHMMRLEVYANFAAVVSSPDWGRDILGEVQRVATIVRDDRAQYPVVLEGEAFQQAVTKKLLEDPGRFVCIADAVLTAQVLWSYFDAVAGQRDREAEEAPAAEPSAIIEP